MCEAPKRAFELRFIIGADSYDELLAHMENFVWFMQREHPDLDHNHNGASGGVDCGYSYDFEVDTSITSEEYHRKLREYLDCKKAQK